MDASSSVAGYLSRLVAFPTLSAVSNLELLRYLDEELARYGARGQRSGAPIDANDDGTLGHRLREWLAKLF